MPVRQLVQALVSVVFSACVMVILVSGAASSATAQGPAPGQAGAGAQGEVKVALVIGNGAYQYAPPLANPVNDAVDMAATLEDLGWTVIEGYDLEFGPLREILRDFARALDEADHALFYYAGHGLQLDGENFMVPVDAKLQDQGEVEFESVALNTAVAQLTRASGTRLVFLDACRDNPLAEDLARQAAAARSAAIGAGLAQLDELTSETLIAYSTQPGATATDGVGRNSPFTAGVLRHIATPGLDVQEMMRRVRQSVMDDTNDLQVPWDNSSLTAGFSFVPSQDPPPSFSAWEPPSRDPSPRQLEVALWDDVKDTGSIAQLQTYLDAHPDGVFVTTASARIADLEAAATADADAAASMADAIAARFAELSSRGVLVAEPQTAAEFYANARIYEVQGDAVNASLMYGQYFTFAEPYVDPHYRNQRLIELRQGLPRAREVYNGLVYDHPDDAIAAFARILLYDRDERVTRLVAYTQANPDFAPAFYELSRQYSRRMLGDQTLTDQRAEKEALERLMELHADGGFLRWFLDQELAAEQLDDAEARLKALQALVLDTPVTMNVSTSNSGFTLYFQVAFQDGATELLVAPEGEAFASLGVHSMVNMTTGKPSPNVYKILPIDAEAQTIQMKYIDKNGAERGPFSFEFDPETAIYEEQYAALQSELGMPWVVIQPNPATGEPLIYFTLLGNRCALSKIEYGVDTDEPDTVHPFAPCDRFKLGHTSMEGDTYYVPFGADAEYLSMRLTYADGTVSEVRRFEPVPQ